MNIYMSMMELRGLTADIVENISVNKDFQMDTGEIVLKEVT